MKLKRSETGDGKQQEAYAPGNQIDPYVACNCNFDQGHEPHCAVVKAHDAMIAARQASQPSQQEEHVESKYQAFSDWYTNRAPVSSPDWKPPVAQIASHASGETGQPSISDMGIGDVAYGIALQAIEGKWEADKLGPYMARFALDYSKEREGAAFQRGQQEMAEKAAQILLRIRELTRDIVERERYNNIANQILDLPGRSLAGASAEPHQPRDLYPPEKFAAVDWAKKFCAMLGIDGDKWTQVIAYWFVKANLHGQADLAAITWPAPPATKRGESPLAALVAKIPKAARRVVWGQYLTPQQESELEAALAAAEGGR